MLLPIEFDVPTLTEQVNLILKTKNSSMRARREDLVRKEESGLKIQEIADKMSESKDSK
jgi:hypothetical protein